MSIQDREISQIGQRILELSSLYSSAKEFLKKCDIPNKSLITDIKKGRSKSPSADYLRKIVRGTGCSGSWLLTGEGEMFEPRRNIDGEQNGSDPNLQMAFSLIEKIEQQAASLKDVELPADVELQLARLLVKVLERRK
jgi:transcriptional regulator with XRE-family HTH domain